MFKSLFAEGRSDTVDIPSESRNDFLHRTCVQVEDDFDVLHNILYYLHTDQITFGTDLTYEPPEKHNPRLCAAEDIYAMADRLLLDELKSKAFNFLKFTCSVENIAARTFSKFSTLYKEIGDIYAAYFRENWKQVKSSKGYEEFFEAMETEADSDNLAKLLKRYRWVMEDDDWRL